MVNRDKEGVVYTDHSSYEQRRNPQHERQSEKLDLNATANEAVGSGNTHMDSGGVQNGQPPPHNPNSGNRTSAFDRIGPSGPTLRPFGGIKSDESHITQELRHRMQSMELEVWELRKENAELRTTTRNLQSRVSLSPRRNNRSRSPPRRNHRSRSPPRRNNQPRTPLRRRHYHSRSDDSESSSEEDHDGSRRTYRRYKRTKGSEVTHPSTAIRPSRVGSSRSNLPGISLS
ncbi:hypothetical protein PIB30_031749 [Stylosanthes scabra]|uniref:Uncharacterized protein n=1 Tax=Stylosanthes scabra TaxID=79078 RepID=A0ABU6VA02_9FABA|nr:hypothetical protein [Stylosanthes scabra]